jgi:hypothetical protein
MPVYEIDLTVPATATEQNPAEKRLFVLGDFITHIEIIFPSGSARRTNVAIFYGIKKLYPFEEDQWFKGNAETFKFDTLDKLPDTINRLRFIGWNNGGRYDHTIGFRIVTKFSFELMERVWLKDLIERLDILLRRIGVSPLPSEVVI